jgi:thiamine monophosphate kinase
LEVLARHLGTSAETLALAGGEDYVLLFTLPAAVAAPAGCSAVGWIVRGRAMRALRGGRDLGPLAPAGYDHLVQR